MKNLISYTIQSFIYLIVLMALFLQSCTTSGNVASAPKVDSQQLQMAKATKELGEAFMAEGNYTSALNEFLKAEKLIPTDPYLHNDLGLTYMAKKRFDLAETHFKKAIELNPEYIPAQNNLGSAYLKQQKWELAIECFKAISDNLLYATPHYPLSNLGWAYLGKRDTNLAKEHFLMALEAEPNFINAIHGLATTYIETSELQAAFNLLTDAINKNDGKGAIVSILYADMARVYEANRQFDKAKESWQKVVDIAPSASGIAQEANERLKQL
ncbi:MAG: tetratricopeptide repeat protein [Desulfamplus sp.]|nr:tetratricopeptide repeat protein [Desulfamplus sp.]